MSDSRKKLERKELDKKDDLYYHPDHHPHPERLVKLRKEMAPGEKKKHKEFKNFFIFTPQKKAQNCVENPPVPKPKI